MTQKYAVRGGGGVKRTNEAAKKLINSFYGIGFHMAKLDNEARRHRRTGVTYRGNGKREMERRRRQIAEGKLTISNGLVAS